MTIKEELQEYARQCLSGVIISGKKHKWACRRFLEDCKKEEAALSLKEPWPYIWNEEEANGIVEWFSLLRHSICANCMVGEKEQLDIKDSDNRL